MRIRASNGKLYDPDKSTLIGKRALPNGTVQTLHRSGGGSYFFYEIPVDNSKKIITPTTYDEALEWADQYGYKEVVDTVMKCPENENRRYTMQLTERNHSKLELIAKKNRLTMKDTIHLIVTESSQIYNGGANTVEKE